MQQRFVHSLAELIQPLFGWRSDSSRDVVATDSETEVPGS